MLGGFTLRNVSGDDDMNRAVHILQSFKLSVESMAKLLAGPNPTPIASAPQIANQKAEQSSQFSSYQWQAFLLAHNLVASMSRGGNCYDNVVAESFFQLLKRERIRRKTYYLQVVKRVHFALTDLYKLDYEFD